MYFRQGQEICLYPKAFEPPVLAPNSFIEWVAGVLLSGEGGGLKRPEREPDHPPRASAEVENEWTYIFIPPYVFVFFTGRYLPFCAEHNLKTHTFRKRDAPLLCRVCSVF